MSTIAQMKLPERNAFTLIELLVVLTVFAILVGLLLSAVQRVRESANVALCRHNMKELALAVHTYHHDRGAMPPYATGRAGEIYGGWFVHMLPYMGHAAMHQQIVVASEPATGSSGVVIIGPAIAMDGIRDAAFPGLKCPSDPTASGEPGRTNYLANWFAFTDGTGGPFGAPQRFVDLSDGLSNTILFAEAYSHCDGLPRLALVSIYHHNFGITQEDKASDDPEYLPNDYTMFQVQPSQCDKWRTQTPHQTMNVATAAGDVRGVLSSIAPNIWKALLKPRDGVVVGEW